MSHHRSLRTDPSADSRESPFVGTVLSHDEVDSGEAALNALPFLRSHLGREVFLSLARAPGRDAVVDHRAERKAVNAGTLLAVAIALARRWRPSLRGARIGIALPPGIGAFLANLAVLLLGRVPVNLNFTAGRASVEAAMRKAGIESIISAAAMRARVADFPWPDATLDISEEITACGKPAIVGWLLAVRLLPATWLAAWLRVPRDGGDAEAALLFTSGSSGEPKGVVLTHRNILGNCLQVRLSNILEPGRTMIGCLPVFHSFGFTITMWYPLLYGLRVATFPSPLETRRLAEIVEAEQADILVGAPTFLRPFLKRAEPEQMQSLSVVIAGAEKLPRDLHDGFVERFGVGILEGYGLTETSPVLAVNRKDPLPRSDGTTTAGARLGSVGPLVAGMRARVVDPDTLTPRDVRETGMLVVRGCNVFAGYLGDPEQSARVLKDGWFVTGDLARFDDDGFLHIEGRLSRFSKIAGEMVPHVTVEQRLIELLGWSGAESQPVVVVGVPDTAKGEVLVVLTTQELTVETVRARLSEAGLPNLWIPRQVVRIERIPVLNTGKLDLRGCRRVAEAANT